ncbi:hypothetical protein APHAL10511_000751 [Amanita phalloides]|nr:hypothetical protein APHAL10511_000751 [Amanita phalloides]
MFSTRGFIFILLLSLSVAGAPPYWPVERRPSSLPRGVPGHTAGNLFHALDTKAGMQDAPLRQFTNRRKRTKPRQRSPDTKTSPGELSGKPQPEAHNKRVKPNSPGEPSDKQQPEAHNHPIKPKSPGMPSDKQPEAHNQPIKPLEYQVSFFDEKRRNPRMPSESKQPEAHNQPIKPKSPGMPSEKQQPEAHNQPINPKSPGMPSDEPLPVHNKPIGLRLDKPQPEAHSGQADPLSPGKWLIEPHDGQAKPKPPPHVWHSVPPGLPTDDVHRANEHDDALWLLRYQSHSGSMHK